MANAHIQIHLHGQEAVSVEWFKGRQGGAGYGVVVLGNVRLYLESNHLDQLAQALEALQRERDEQESGK